MSQQTLPRITTTVTTTDATPTTACSLTVPLNTAASCIADITGRNASTGDVITACLKLGAKRGAGAAAQVGSTQTFGNNIADVSYLLAAVRAVTEEMAADQPQVRAGL